MSVDKPNATTRTVQRLNITTKTFMTLLLTHAMVDAYGSMWPVFKMLAKLDLATAGMIAFVTNAIALPTQMFFGVWADRGNRRKLILIGLAMCSTTAFLGTVGQNHELAVTPAGYLILGLLLLPARLGQAMFHPSGASVAGNLDPHRRSTLVSTFVAGGMIGFAAGPGLFSLVYTRSGGQTEWLLIPILFVLLLGVLWCHPKEERSGRPTPFIKALSALRPIWGRVMTLYLILALLSAMLLGMNFLLPEFIEARGYPKWMVYGGGMGFMTLGAVLGMIPAGLLADRIGRKRLLLTCLSLGLVAYYVFLAVPTIPLILFIGMCMIVGALMSAGNPLGVALGQSFSPPNASLISGIMMGLAWATGSTSTWLVGYLAERIDTVATLNWLGLGWFVAIGLMIALMLSMTKTHADPVEPGAQ